jgi:hypothetical protein
VFRAYVPALHACAAVPVGITQWRSSDSNVRRTFTKRGIKCRDGCSVETSQDPDRMSPQFILSRRGSHHSHSPTKWLAGYSRG